MKWKYALIPITVLAVLSLLFLYIDSYSLANTKYASEEFQDTLYIHFIHASAPYKSCKNLTIHDFPYEWGHVVIEMDSLIYGFEYEDKDDIHFLPKNNKEDFNAIFTKDSTTNWINRNRFSRRTVLKIPIAQDKKIRAFALLNSYTNKIPYDYAFLGMRCASATYKILGEAGVIPKSSRGQAMRHAFYPGQLRATLTSWASNNGIIVDYHDGAICRMWE